MMSEEEQQSRTTTMMMMEDEQGNHNSTHGGRGGMMRRRRSSRRSSGFRTGLQRGTIPGRVGDGYGDDEDDGNSTPTRSSSRGGGSMAAAAAAAARAVAEELLLSPHDEGDGDSENETEYEDRPMGVDNDEVLEQYRIMAQLEAHLRVKENTGFDMAEYQEQRRTKQAAAAAEAAAAAVNNPPGCYLHSTGRLPPPILPQPRMVKEWNNTLVPQEPPLRAPTPTPRGLRSPHSGVIVPEVCDGVVVRGGEGGNSTTMAAPEGEHLVRCLGCKSTLRVPLLASLVRCPECSTISPACTRRW